MLQKRLGKTMVNLNVIYKYLLHHFDIKRYITSIRGSVLPWGGNHTLRKPCYEKKKFGKTRVKRAHEFIWTCILWFIVNIFIQGVCNVFRVTIFILFIVIGSSINREFNTILCPWSTSNQSCFMDGLQIPTNDATLCYHCYF